MAHRCSSRSSVDTAVKGQSELDSPEQTETSSGGPGAGSDNTNHGARAAEASHGGAALPPSTRIDTGWKPWKVVLGCFCLTVPTYGLLSGIGLFQTYWHHAMLRNHSESDISWIISVFGFLNCLSAAPAGILFDRYGSRWLLPLGCAAYVASFIGLACSWTYAQLMACMALAGVTSAVPTTIAFSVVSQWFGARKGLAIGCVTLGAALGGIFFSLVLEAFFDRFPWQTAALVLTATMAALLLLGNVLVETNVPRRAASEDSEGRGVYHVLTCSEFWLVSYTLFGSIPSYAVSAGIGNKQFYLMVSYNIGAVIGQDCAPWLSDHVLGPLNATISMNVFTLLVVLTIWMPLGTSSIAALFLVAVLMGIGTGSFVPLGVSCINALCNPLNTATWLGAAYSILAFATLIGNPASAAILAQYRSYGLVAFLAAVLFSAMISAAALRWLVLGRRWIVKARA
ncbi:hypothetical protein C8A03DRAFT_41864 [Achaetomium macrosporum]|uniref:Uncharacterized protein n=1 Tax=Achaetomium macrosporum TaxID=79813 RepID=A0AAN7CEM6_9PEZI|nr:hypothetical protein C8A03DRAFT_41864 [Achaetomium macrosporum]